MAARPTRTASCAGTSHAGTLAATYIPSDLLVKVGGVNFHVHKHPMVTRSARLALLVDHASTLHGPDAVTVLELPDLPGGHGSFELAAKFCYGVVVDITAANVSVLRCAAEYLEMTEMEEGNLAFRAEAFLSYVVASSWRDSIAVLRTCDDSLSPWADDLQLVRRCSESVAAKACTSPRAVRWAYAGGGRTSSPKTPRTAGTLTTDGGSPPADWWVDDVCVLRIDHFVRVVTAVQARGMRPDLIGAAITRYFSKWLSSSGIINKESPPSRGGVGVLLMVVAGEDDDTEMAGEQRRIVESLISIIPPQKDNVSCSFLIRLLRLAVILKAAPALVTEVEKHVRMQLDQAALSDILVPLYTYGGRSEAAYNVDLVQRLVEQFVVQEHSGRAKEKRQDQQQQHNSNSKALRVASLIDSYLAEVSRDRNLALGKFKRGPGAPPLICTSYLMAVGLALRFMRTNLRTNPTAMRQGCTREGVHGNIRRASSRRWPSRCRSGHARATTGYTAPSTRTPRHIRQ